VIKLEVRHNPEARRFEAFVDGELCRADYRMSGDLMHIVHTEVPQRFEGRGLARQVVQAALDFARANGLAVVPVCGYVRAYMRRHKTTHDLFAEGYRG
jgi:predicted GNAT family acetyltransferase